MRLFVAVWPPPEVLDAVAALPRPALTRGRWTSRDQWHVTLRFLGTVADPEPVVELLSSVDLPTAEATVGPATTALSRSILCVPVAGLDALASVVIDATAALGQPPDERPFHAHLTLARLTSGSARRHAGVSISATFPVRGVAVVSSETHREGARYQVLATIPAGDP